MIPLDTKSIRKQLRKTRQLLALQQQNLHSEQALQHVKNLLESSDLFATPQKIAIFLSQDGELDTKKVIEYLWQHTNHEVYLPILETGKHGHMAFARYTPESKLIVSQFGIPEPSVPLEQHLNSEHLNRVFMPLVGFDKQGNRIGMGGGYYDRTFEFTKNSKNHNTYLIGWAHSCQQVEKLPNEPWDIPLNAIITEQGFTAF